MATLSVLIVAILYKVDFVKKTVVTFPFTFDTVLTED